MTTFDRIVPEIEAVLRLHTELLKDLVPLVINRDLRGKVRLILPSPVREQPAGRAAATLLAAALAERLGSHAYKAEEAILYEADPVAVSSAAPGYDLSGFTGVRVVDRLAIAVDWAAIAPPSPGPARITFFSIKGGVGRSTALAASAWALAQRGKRVLVLDLDLESPGLSSALLPEERRPKFGIADWLVEDLVGNGEAVFEAMIATSPLSHDGEIYVVPAHGLEPGEYIAKLGRVWMGKLGGAGATETWSRRLARLVAALETRLAPDVVLIDSRSGIDEVAAGCVADLGARLTLLFAIDGEQTWSGYRMLFEHWNRAGVSGAIRERLQCIGAMIPEDEGRHVYFQGLRERAWATFAELYDEVPPGVPAVDFFNYDESDASAPHYPVPVNWSRGFATLRSLHARLQDVDPTLVEMVYGPLIETIWQVLDVGGDSDA